MGIRLQETEVSLSILFNTIEFIERESALI